MYIVEALRYGDRENHSYVVGIYTSKDVACEVAIAHECWRGGKYECSITKMDVNYKDDDEFDVLHSSYSLEELHNMIKERMSKIK